MDEHLVILQLRLMQELSGLRAQLERGFSPETAQHGLVHRVLSAGQCAAVAVVLHELLGGQLVSARVEGESHWFNRLPTPEGEVDVDITADQFGFPPVRIASIGELYPGTRVRSEAEISPETRHRSELLKRRAVIAPSSVLNSD
jgi:hypothetical protein